MVNFDKLTNMTVNQHFREKLKFEPFISSWIGFELVHRHARMWNDSSIVIENKPTFLSGIMQGSGNKPPGVVPDKMMYMMRDLERINRHTQSKWPI